MDASVQEDSAASSSGHVSGLAASLDHISLRSKSPEDTSSLLSASAGSLDSVLNHSRDEEEIQALMDPVEDSVFPSSNILTHG
jgi:Rap guanine nucleotide exchange factor 1